VAVSATSLIPVVLPYKRHIPSILQMTDEETKDLATILKRILVRYDNVFK
jgi:UDPglucose--hexose-1-phosphate uridylyltransferase